MDQSLSHQPLVSVIVPTHNRPDLLERALDSIESQEYRRIEAVVVNDGGRDITELVAQFSRAWLVIHEKNLGLPAARNTGIRAATGEYIAYLDDDDWFYPDHIEILVMALRNGDRAAYTDSAIIDKDRSAKLYMSNVYDHDRLRRGNLFPVCCVMHERSLIDEVGLFDEALPSHEDWELWIRISDVTDFAHVKNITCAVDRSRPTMMNEGDRHSRGYWMVRNRYGS